MIGTFRLALAAVCGDVVTSSLETILAGLGCDVPELVSRTHIALISIEEGEIRRAGLAFLSVEVVGLAIWALIAC